MTGVHAPCGQHILADLYGIALEHLNDAVLIEALLNAGAAAAGATILSSHFHHFGAGQGVTGVVLLAESHISIHTWPEAGYAALDIFMCGAGRPALALALIQLKLQPTRHQVTDIRRGL